MSEFEDSSMTQLVRIIQESFPHLTKQEIKLRMLKAAKSPIYQKIQLLKGLGASQNEVNTHFMGLLVTFMRLPSDDPQLTKLGN